MDERLESMTPGIPLIVFLLIICGNSAAEPIRILNWWNYLDPKVLKKVEALGENLQVTEYRSNEVALSKLSSKKHGFDIVIVSNTILPILNRSKLIDQQLLIPLLANRKAHYIEELITNNGCVPFQWSSSVYSYDNRYLKTPPSTISALVGLRSSGIRVGIIDDQFEVATRILLDDFEGCKSKRPLDECIKNIDEMNFARKEDFTSSIEQIVKTGKFVTYGWHGESAVHLAKAPYLTLAVPKSRPVVGVDYVCIMNSSRKSRAKLVEIVKNLTDRESIGWNMQATQYFSPYHRHFEGLHPKVMKLCHEILDLIKLSDSVEIRPPGQKKLKSLNRWWQSVRYE